MARCADGRRRRAVRAARGAVGGAALPGERDHGKRCAEGPVGEQLGRLGWCCPAESPGSSGRVVVQVGVEGAAGFREAAGKESCQFPAQGAAVLAVKGVRSGRGAEDPVHRRE